MVKRLVWAVGILLVVVVVGLAAYVTWTWDRAYDAPLPEVRISTDPAVLARGEYLVYGPAHCVECHGSADGLQKLAEGAKVPLSGGIRFPMDPLGAVYSRNLTPDTETGIGRYSDAQIARMTTEDIGALYEYLHTLAPQDGPAGEPTFKKAD